MGNIEVNLIGWTTPTNSFDSEWIMEEAAKVCYGNWNKGIVDRCLEAGHLSIAEHINFTFKIEGISRACSHQLVRHRIASYSQKSQRKDQQFEFVVPPSIENNVEAKTEYSLVLQLMEGVYTKLMSLGVKPEDARYILPNATTTDLIASFNFRSLINFCNQRLCSKAQWEIRELAELMVKEVKNVGRDMEELAEKYLVPKCRKDGFCSEKKPCDKLS